jgi:hypothetical protein
VIVVRQRFQARFGYAADLIELLKEMDEYLRSDARVLGHRILSDLSGAFFVVVDEYTVDTMAIWEEISRDAFADPTFGALFERMVSMTESGSREFYAIEL